MNSKKIKTIKADFENIIKKAMKEGKSVDNVSIKFDRAKTNSARPDGMKVVFTISGKDTEVYFKNKMGGK